jgi:hypothetical protein
MPTVFSLPPLMRCPALLPESMGQGTSIQAPIRMLGLNSWQKIKMADTRGFPLATLAKGMGIRSFWRLCP